MEGICTRKKLDVKSKEYLDWVEESTLFGPISNMDAWGNNNFSLIPLLYGMVDTYFKENKGDNMCLPFGNFYQCYRVQYNGNGYLIGRRSSFCSDYRVARYAHNDNLVDMEDIQAYMREHNKVKVKQKL